MPQTGWTSADTVVPVSHTFMETAANSNMYGVIAGCGVTLDAADLTFDVAAGAIVHNGKSVAVSAQTNAGTLVADGSNPRFTLIYLDSTGTAGFTSGTAASSPVPPDQGDYVPLMLVRIAAAATIASSQTNYDLRVFHRVQVWRISNTFTKNNDDTLGDVTGIKLHVGANDIWAFAAHMPAVIGATPDIKCAFTVPSSGAIAGSLLKQEAASVVYAYDSDLTSATALTSANAGIGVEIKGLYTGGGTAGIVQLQAAQNTTTVEDTQLLAGGYIVGWRVQ